MKMLTLVVCMTLLGCGGDSGTSDLNRYEYTDPPESTPLLNAFGRKVLDVDRVVIESDGKAVVVVIHLKRDLQAAMKAEEEAGGIMLDPAWIYFDTDNNAKTGGFATPGLGGFEVEAMVISLYTNDEVKTRFSLKEYEQGESSFDMDVRISGAGKPGALERQQERQDVMNLTESQISVDGAAVTVRFPYESIGSASGKTIRIRMREHHRGPYLAEDFFPDAVLQLK